MARPDCATQPGGRWSGDGSRLGSCAHRSLVPASPTTALHARSLSRRNALSLSPSSSPVFHGSRRRAGQPSWFPRVWRDGWPAQQFLSGDPLRSLAAGKRANPRVFPGRPVAGENGFGRGAGIDCQDDPRLGDRGSKLDFRVCLPHVRFVASEGERYGLFLFAHGYARASSSATLLSAASVPGAGSVPSQPPVRHWRTATRVLRGRRESGDVGPVSEAGCSRSAS